MWGRGRGKEVYIDGVGVIVWGGACTRGLVGDEGGVGEEVGAWGEGVDVLCLEVGGEVVWGEGEGAVYYQAVCAGVCN